MDAGFDENEAELGVLILAVLLQVLSDVHGFLDQVVQILGQLGSQTCEREQTQREEEKKKKEEEDDDDEKGKVLRVSLIDSN